MSDAPVLTAYGWVPKSVRGKVRDLRIRWACEEIGLPYRTHLLDATAPRGEDYVRWHPFDQVPAWRDDEVEMFESGAILLRLAEGHDRLLPTDPAVRWRAISWLFAAFSSIEPPLAIPTIIKVFNRDQPWAEDASRIRADFARKRLRRLADALGEKDYLVGPFTIADIAMSTVFLVDSLDLVEEQPVLVAYRERCRSRPAFARALDAQLADFTFDPPATR